MSIIKSTIKSTWKLTSKAEEVWNGLNGMIAVYKPTGNSTQQTRNTIIMHLCRDLNELEVRPCKPYVSIEGETNKPMRVVVKPSYADHELVIGPRYQDDDLKLAPAHYLTREMSGIMLFGINKGTKMITKIKSTNPMRFYKVKGILGQATDNYFITGKIVERSTYNNVKRHHIDMVCAAIQSSHQKKMFELCGVDIQSQAAYNLAVQGPIRPVDKNIPMLYSIKCIDFHSPEFMLEIVCLNENPMFLKNIVHGMGLQLRSTATCTLIQCNQYGIFNLDIALLKRDWDLDSIMKNMHNIRYILTNNQFLFKQDDPILRQYVNHFPN